MDQSSQRAQVFISCGQRSEEERKISVDLQERLQKMNFDSYVAVDHQSLRAVKENIFHELESSEYFIFIDFKREKIVGKEDSKEKYRGSLFSHQELGVASFLDKEVIAFQEDCVEQKEGLLGFLQANTDVFYERDNLVDKIIDKIKERSWNPYWKNTLKFEIVKPYEDAFQLGQGVSRFFHIGVRNLHKNKAARNCYVYLDGIQEVGSKRLLQIESTELKWAGYIYPNALIQPGSVRRFDAIVVQFPPYNLTNSTPKMKFNQFTDSTAYVPNLPVGKDLEIRYAIISENFTMIKGRFLLKVGKEINDFKLEAL